MSSLGDVIGGVWIFQFNPDLYPDFEDALRGGLNTEEWPAAQLRRFMDVGQRIYFWRSGGRAGAENGALVAAGCIASSVHNARYEDGKHGVDVRYDYLLSRPLTRAEVWADDILARYRPMAKGAFATNFLLPALVAARIGELVSPLLQPLSSSDEPSNGSAAALPDVPDSRERRQTEVVLRQGQAAFRAALMAAYEGRCALTGCDVAQALQAAHIVPYRGEETNVVTNGLLLRADIHALFDAGLIVFDTSASPATVLLGQGITNSIYAQLNGQPLRLPSNRRQHPDVEALEWHRHQWSL